MKKLIAVAAVLATSLSALVLAEPSLGTVVVVGQRTDGANILCRGAACADVLQSMQQRAAPFEMEFAMLTDVPVDGAQFCGELRGQRPSGCSLASPPPSPGLGGNWQPTGCGTGRISRAFLEAALRVAATNTFSNDIDAPHSGVSFLSACNEHDRCYAVAGGKDSCDMTFRDNMQAACGGASNNAACQGWASLYHGTVSRTDLAQSAYNSSSGQRECALWASDMKENACQ